MDKFVVSARKYRPATFNEVVGQSNITNTLKNAIKNEHLAQAFLFTGPRGVGKTTCARIFAKTINCEHPTEDMEPCNACESCLSFNNTNSFNVHELDAASNNSVDDIRRLVEQVRIPPQIGQYKVYIIDEVHMLSQAAFNAFLKTLEEPPDYAKFILATTEKHKIIPTILSRCQIYDFNRITVNDIVEHLKYVAQNEGVEAEEDALHIVAQKADGALRDALSIFDQLVSFSGNKLSYESTINNLNVLDVEHYFKLTGYILHSDIASSLLLYDEILSKGFDSHHFINGLAAHFRNLLVVKDPETVKLLEVPELRAKNYVEQAQYCSYQFLTQAIDICSQVDLHYKVSLSKRLFVELNLLKLCKINGALAEPAAIKPLPDEGQGRSIAKPLREQEPKVESPTEETAAAMPRQQPIPKAPQAAKEQQDRKAITPPPDLDEKTPESAAPQAEKQAIESTEESTQHHKIKRRKRKASHSIQELLKDEQENDEQQEFNLAAAVNQSFDKVEKEIDADTLKAAVLEYAQQIKKDKIAFSMALTPNRIHCGPNNTVNLSFNSVTLNDNSWKYDLMEWLKKKFNNQQIQLKVEIVEEEAPKSDTPMKQYNKMKEKNPVVDEVRRQLNLDF